jgi:hypothetical protein
MAVGGWKEEDSEDIIVFLPIQNLSAQVIGTKETASFLELTRQISTRSSVIEVRPASVPHSVVRTSVTLRQGLCQRWHAGKTEKGRTDNVTSIHVISVRLYIL